MAMDKKPLMIFDCDGVLVDSEPLAKDIVLALIAEAGYVFTENDYYQHLLGKSQEQDVQTLKQRFGIEITIDAFKDAESRLLSYFKQALKPTIGVKGLLAQLDCDRCVASSSSLERIELSLSLTGLRQYFDSQIFSASMVTNGKPAPDLFLHAACTLGYQPDQCIVIEDSPSGIQAAQAAGMTVVAYLGGSHTQPAGLEKQVVELQPDAVIDDMSKLPQALLQRWQGDCLRNDQ